ncbi:hypothetical protein RIF29_11516 [Crotalaria pallida]|uniref:Uncharacterized protein n=1 Tax=Crotalaria pallida TaxID=3830 RepID=A0AAN9P1A7_CROPI
MHVLFFILRQNRFSTVSLALTDGSLYMVTNFSDSKNSATLHIPFFFNQVLTVLKCTHLVDPCQDSD